MISLTQIGGGGRRPIAVQSLIPTPIAHPISSNRIVFRRSDLRVPSLKWSSSIENNRRKKKEVLVTCASSSYGSSRMVAGLTQCGVPLAKMMIMAVLLIPNPISSSLLPAITDLHGLLVRVASYVYSAVVAYNCIQDISFIVDLWYCPTPDPGSVLQLQVMLLDTARLLNKRYKEITNESTSGYGLYRILTEIRRDLLNHKHHWISASSYWKVERRWKEAEKHYGKLHNEEIAKRRDMKSKDINTSSVTDDGYIMVTILVRASGECWIPIIRPTTLHFDLEYALQQLGQITSTQIESLWVAWTPVSSKKQLVEYYPDLEPST